MADTYCFGDNFRPISFTSEEYTLYPFPQKYKEKVNITICNGVDALTLNSGELVIMEFGQGLWFGNRMEKLMTKPNQCQNFGIKMCDDPTDPHRKLLIEAS